MYKRSIRSSMYASLLFVAPLMSACDMKINVYGNGTCESDETHSNCPADCDAVIADACVDAPCCGNGSCESGENCRTCPVDCGECIDQCAMGASCGCIDGSCAEECQTDDNCPEGRRCVDTKCVPE